MRAVCETSVALVVRKGNPKNVHTWEDLLQPGLQVQSVVSFSEGVTREGGARGYGGAAVRFLGGFEPGGGCRYSMFSGGVDMGGPGACRFRSSSQTDPSLAWLAGGVITLLCSSVLPHH